MTTLSVMDSSWIISGPLAAIAPQGADTGGARMPLARFVADMEHYADLSRSPLAAWMAGETMDLVHLGLLGVTMAAAPTLGAALRCFQRYFGALQSASAAEFEVIGDTAHFRYAILDQDIWPRQADADLTLGVVADVVRRYAAAADRVVTVQFETVAGRSRPAVAAHLGRPLRQGDDNAIALPARLLDCRAIQTDVAAEDAFTAAMATLKDEFHRIWLRQPTSHRVLQTMLARMGRAAVDQDAIARHLGMSRRTLRRQLDSEGVAFHELTELCRRNIGLALLVRSNLPMIEIALRLGYSDHTAFSRAFSRWFGQSPRALRQSGSGRRVST
ncbi:MAG: AraC family transcriptional regulator ligand-binding domain-containing protein [Paracoccus sp. (in: a-proteobacteria)]|nr:AraC family transcriptional regulator ligand-binding domain-containing protein [Paracoccus sp. (in: a-proteobacteria)]